MTEHDRDLLDRLCAARAQGIVYRTVKRLPNSARRSIRRLRFRGLIALDSLRPSTSAMAQWRARAAAEGDAPDTSAQAVGEGDSLASPAPAEEAAAAQADSGPAEPAAADDMPPPPPARRRVRQWTDEEDAALRRAYADGMSAGALGRAIGRSSGSIYGRAAYLGLAHPTRPAKAKARQSEASLPPPPPPPADSGSAELAAADKTPRLQPPGGARQRLLTMLEELAEKGAPAPRNAEIADAMGWLATNYATEMLTALQKAQAIKIERRGTDRRITIVRSGQSTGWTAPRSMAASPAQAPASRPAAPPPPVPGSEAAMDCHGYGTVDRPAPSPPASARTAAAIAASSGVEHVNWELAKRVQQRRRSAATKLRNGVKATSLKSAGADAFFTARAAERTRANQERLAMPVEQAKIALQRRGRIVYRASVAGGRADRWFCSGLGKEVTDEQLIAEAERLAS